MLLLIGEIGYDQEKQTEKCSNRPDSRLSAFAWNDVVYNNSNGFLSLFKRTRSPFEA